MVTPEVTKFRIDPFWNDEYKYLDYEYQTFNDSANIDKWTKLGYTGPITGVMCDLNRPQPEWTKIIMNIFANKGWKDIGACFYRMDTGVVLPVHSDLYIKYIDLFNLKGRERTINRAILFLENWQSGHYAEYCNEPYVNWRAGDCVYWNYDVEHMAANIGLTPRYTLQITGHL